MNPPFKENIMFYINLFVFTESVPKGYSWLFSESASNFGTFLAGVGTIILGFLGLRSLYLWKRQKQLERKSEYAAVLLGQLNLFEIELDEWLKYIFLVLYYPDPNELNDEEKKKALLQKIKDDPCEVRNYAQKGNKLLNNLKLMRLDGSNVDPSIVGYIKKLEEGLDKVIKAFDQYTFQTKQNLPPKQKAPANKILCEKFEYGNPINEIRAILNKHKFFEY